MPDGKHNPAHASPHVEEFVTPEWAKHAVWYQIMLDRFRNGNPNNDPQPVHPWTSHWFTEQPYEKAKEGQSFYHEYAFDRHYGGDLDGLESKLDYLKKLGINALYLNPVFIGGSFHKYNAINYLHIDPDFGVENDDYDDIVKTEVLTDPQTWQWTKSDLRFLSFLANAKSMGFHVIIDGVFNHVGVNHPAFADVKRNRWQSPYVDWFDVTSWEPFEYKCWAGFHSLPEFKKTEDGLASKEAERHIFDVTARWMAPNGDPGSGIDGWRLDVPNELPSPFWQRWRKHVKEINPEAFITGEIWDDATRWLDGTQFDAVMNYPFARAAIAWIANIRRKITVSEFDHRLRTLRLAYPRAAMLVLQNLLDSHDTDRIASMVLNPDREYDQGNRVQDNNPNYINAKPTEDVYQRVRLLVLLQMTYVGAPMVYYGDEVGMWGADDPTCRKPMLWEDLEPYELPSENHVEKNHLEFFRDVIHLRRSHPALRTGVFETIITDNRRDIWAFLRHDSSEQLAIVLNPSAHKRRVCLPITHYSSQTWKQVFGSRTTIKKDGVNVCIWIPPIEGIVLHTSLAD